MFAKRFQKPNGQPLKKAQPHEVIPALGRLIIATGEDVHDDLILSDIPVKHDGSVMAGAHLVKEGRSTAVELNEARQAHPSLANKVELPKLGVAYVVARTLYKEKWVKTSARKPAELIWEKKPVNDLMITASTAKQIAKLTFEQNSKRLFKSWEEAGIVYGGTTRNTLKFNLEQWRKLRLEHGVALWDVAADHFWAFGARGYPNCLCNCHAFSVWCTCEHEQVVRSLEQPDFHLTVPGSQGQVGRKRGLRRVNCQDALLGNQESRRGPNQLPQPHIRYAGKKGMLCTP